MNFKEFLTESVWDDIKERWFKFDVDNVPSFSPDIRNRMLDPKAKTLRYANYQRDLDRYKELKDKRMLTPEEADISNWMNKSHKEFVEFMIQASERRSTKSEVRKAKEGKKLIFEDDNVLILEILTWEASCFYGRGTEWCISAKDDSAHAWTQYKNKIVDVFFIFDRVDNDKYAVLWDPVEREINSIWDSVDYNIGELPEHLRPYLKYIK